MYIQTCAGNPIISKRYICHLSQTLDYIGQWYSGWVRLTVSNSMVVKFVPCKSIILGGRCNKMWDRDLHHDCQWRMNGVPVELFIYPFQTVQDCVQYYYTTKKNENYKQLLRKSVKKRRPAVNRQQVPVQRGLLNVGHTRNGDPICFRHVLVTIAAWNRVHQSTINSSVVLSVTWMLVSPIVYLQF